MSWLYVPGLEGSNSESVWLSRTLARSCSWRGKSQPPRAWWRRWKQGGFIRLLSGLTCSPSTLDRGVASFISSLRETPARTTALPESEPEPLAQGSSLPRSAASPQSAGLILSSERTCRGTRTDNSKPSSRHWSDWATALRQEYSARRRPEIPCGASDCSSWPSARTSDTNVAGEHCESLTWPAPAARDHKGSSASSIVRQDGKVRNDMLDYAAEQFFHPPSSPDQPIAGGSMCSTDGPNSNQPSAKRKLNPIFVEALMRWPTGLSGFERREMAWTRWWQLMHSFVSALVSQKDEPKQGSLF